MSQLASTSSTMYKQNYSLMTAILFWCGLVVVSSLYLTIPLISIFADNFNITAAQAAWTGSSFSLFYAVGFLFFGPLSDRYGRKQIILFGLITLTIISPILGFVDSFPTLIILRSVQGIAAATFAPSALAYAVEMFPTEKRVTAIGFVSTGFLMAGIVGQVFASFISQQFGWQSVFYTLGVVYMFTAILATLFIPKDDNSNKKGSLLTAFKQMRAVLMKKTLLLCYVITITLLLSFVGMYTALGNYLSVEFSLSNQEILYVRSVGIVGMLLSPFAGKLVATFGIHNVLRGGVTLAVLGLAIIGISTNLSFLIIMSVIFVAGISITVPTLISLIGQLSGEVRGAAVSLYTFILFIGASLGPIVSVWFLKTGSYLLTFELLALLLGIGLPVSFFIKPAKN
ncbi:MFS transporter [Fervidibacillus albus]|uniref:MFS transporter n=1 Tax=Fervidibacillus albus TaxID=2980026 RepID=A0A9E8RW32_9BACI|nr:MFS transporter [Fervidibacillus albus]WAA09869.1 MFS transporter [Fervidibacillus albus]